MANAPRDNNRVPTLLGTSSTDGTTPIPIYADPTTHRLKVDVAVSGSDINSHITVDTFTSTNNQTVFTASQTVIGTIYLSINGAIQTPSSDYSVSGSTATLSSGIPSGNIVLWCYIY